MDKKKILILVEGAKTDVVLMERLFTIYHEIDAKYQIVSYSTNIYTLYQELFEDDAEPDDLELLQLLKAREKDADKKMIFDDRYTDILLIFDLDPHDTIFTDDKIKKMQAFFCESSDMGKLYINYPMVEAFYHMKTIPDPEFNDRTVTLAELTGKTYKERVRKESKGRDYRKFIASRQECNTVILQNMNKACALLEIPAYQNQWVYIDSLSILNKQLAFWKNDYLHVLCTCVFFIYDYNDALLNAAE